MIAIRAAKIYTPLTCIEPGILLIDRGVIKDVIPDQGQQFTGMEVIDASSHILASGLIDLHTHGIGGDEAMGGAPQGIVRMAENYARHGVTGFLATIGGLKEEIETGIAATLAAQPQGAEILGIHLEGPFINPQRKGAFPPETIVLPDLTLLDNYLQQAQGFIKLITLAPEMDNALALVRRARQDGVICSAGHTQASWEQMMAAIEAGVSHATHTFNAMPPFNHRDPGVLGVVLTDDRVTAEIIADGIHVHPAIVKLLLRSKPADKVAVVSDSIGAAGLPDGTYHFEGSDIIIANRSARLKDGSLAGSVTSLEKELLNLIRFGGITLGDALRIASHNPAAELGLQNRKGSLAAGCDADVICLDGQTLALRWTMARGNLYQPV
jgi:N-acetylglucosamine-6-phosphate deacetylase